MLCAVCIFSVVSTSLESYFSILATHFSVVHPFDKYLHILWCWRRLLRVPWTARRSNLSILKDIILGIHGRTDVEAETPILWPPDAKS